MFVAFINPWHTWLFYETVEKKFSHEQYCVKQNERMKITSESPCMDSIGGIRFQLVSILPSFTCRQEKVIAHLILNKTRHANSPWWLDGCLRGDFRVGKREKTKTNPHLLLAGRRRTQLILAWPRCHIYFEPDTAVNATGPDCSFSPRSMRLGEHRRCIFSCNSSFDIHQRMKSPNEYKNVWGRLIMGGTV